MICRILLFAVVCIHIFLCTYFFSNVRQGVHSDEIWSYGLSNSIGQPHFTTSPGVYIDDQENADYWANYNVWLKGKAYHDYITIQEDERFDLVGVYKNMSLDHHPFLFFWLVNIVCSFFPDRFSFWYVFVLQMFFLIGTQIYLYRLGKLILREKKWSPLLVCLFYALGQGGMLTFSFLRQYSLLTMFVVMHIYYQMVFFRSEDLNIKKYMIPVTATALLGLLTHYYMVSVAFGATFMICLYLLYRKKVKKMFAYGFSMVGVICTFLIIWPYAIRNMKTGNGSYVSYPMETQIKAALSDTLDLVSGLTISIYRSAAYAYLVIALVFIIAIGAPLCFLFRKEAWFIALREKVFSYGKDLFARRGKLFGYFYFIIPVIAVIYVIVVSKTVDIFKMGDFYKRYLFPIMPLFCIELFGICEYVLLHIPAVKKAAVPLMMVISVGFAGFSQLKPNIFTVRQPGNMTQFQASDFFEGKNVEMLLTSYSVPIYVSHIFYKTENIKICGRYWIKGKEKEELKPICDDFYYVFNDENGVLGDVYDFTINEKGDSEDLTQMEIDQTHLGQAEFQFESKEGKSAFNEVISNSHDPFTVEDEISILDYFKECGFDVRFVDDISTNGVLLKIYHVSKANLLTAEG